MKKRFAFIFIAILGFTAVHAQNFTKADSLRGMLRYERSCYDVHYYELNLDFNLEEKFISGRVDMHFNVKKPTNLIQVDLYENMSLDKVMWGQIPLSFKREENAVWVHFPNPLSSGSNQSIRMYYHGNPTIAKNAPWDGGFVFSKDSEGKPFVGVACEGDGASLWWPNKDHLSDEPDSMRISGTVPEDLMFVSNGNLERTHSSGESPKKTFTWKVNYPINNYNVTACIANYVHFSDTYTGAKGALKLDYYVLPENEAKARKQFEQVKPMLEVYEKYFGPYPFWKDGFALVETPYLGMEHQSAIAYGNQYKPGYLGMHPPGVDFDYIIIHETGHEYWGNHVSMKDIADMWIHESFCTYSESVFVEGTMGYEEAVKYLKYQMNFITNASPIMGTHGMNQPGNGTDMYYKGAWMLHTIRSVINNDEVWWSLLRGIQDEFGMKTVTGDEIIEYCSQKAGIELDYIFYQYLNRPKPPRLEYKIEKKFGKAILHFRWNDTQTDFVMPMDLLIDGERVRIRPFTTWQSIELKKSQVDKLAWDTDRFYVKPLEVK